MTSDGPLPGNVAGAPGDPGTPSSPRAAVESFPQVPGVRLEKEIGRGGFAMVYRGHQISVDRDVAVKVDNRRLADARDRRRFAREIVAAGMVSAHPHIVTLYDGGMTADDHPYLVMELYPGGSYADKLRATGPVPVSEVLDVGFGIADALVAAHGEGILHRDVKPGNILISRYGTPALADFGLAALPTGADGYSVTMESLTPSYAAPEAFGGVEPTVAMDVYALGTTLYAMLQGRPPRSDGTGSSPPIARLLLMLNEPLPALSMKGTDDVMRVIWRATAVLPAERYPTAAALRDALAAVRAGRPESSGGIRPVMARPAIPAAREPDSERVSPPSTASAPLRIMEEPSLGSAVPRPSTSPRRRWIGAAAAAAVVAVLLTGAILVGRTSPLAGVPVRAAGVTTSNPPLTSFSVPTPSIPRSSESRPGVTTNSATSSVVRTTPSTPSVAPTTTATTPPSLPSSSAQITGSQVVAVAPPVGTCFAGLVEVGDRISASAVADCTQPHYWEAYATGVLAATTPDPYAAALAKDPVVMKTCTKAVLQAYLGPDAHGTFDTDVLPPTDVAFTQGRRGFWCLVAQNGAGQVTGSLREG